MSKTRDVDIANGLALTGCQLKVDATNENAVTDIMIPAFFPVLSVGLHSET